MIDYDKLESRFFAEGPNFCRMGAVCLIGAGLGLSLLGALLKPAVPLIEHLSFAGLLAIPAGFLAILSITISRRHTVTIPLVAAICLFGGRFLLVRPDEALAGIEMTRFHWVISWIVYFVVIAGILWMLEFMWRLWRKGAFN